MRKAERFSYQNKVNFNLTFIQKPGNHAHNCEMVHCLSNEGVISQANKTIKHCQGCVIYQMMKDFNDQPLSIQFLRIFHPLPYNRKKDKRNV